eukprot:3064824-Amphidinium_carterae.1
MSPMGVQKGMLSSVLSDIHDNPCRPHWAPQKASQPGLSSCTSPSAKLHMSSRAGGQNDTGEENDV